jgi:hypothetical protein
VSEQRFDCESLVGELPVIQSIFSSGQEAIQYCKEFQNIGKVWTLYHVAQFSFFLGKIKEVYGKLDFYSQALMDINRLVMIASMIELLNSKEDFKRFDKWIKQEGKDKLDAKGVVAIWHSYNKIHGSAHKFRRFFDKYLTKDEKIRLIKSVQFWKPEEKSFFPLFCFKGDACNVQHSHCTYDTQKEECPAQKSDRVTHLGIEECANFLYALRSEFVHEAKLFFLPKPLPEGVGGSSWVVDYLEYDFSTKDYPHRGSVMLELFSNQLVILVEKYLKKLMKDYLEIRQSSTTTSTNIHSGL